MAPRESLAPGCVVLGPNQEHLRALEVASARQWVAGRASCGTNAHCLSDFVPYFRRGRRTNVGTRATANRGIRSPQGDLTRHRRR